MYEVFNWNSSPDPSLTHAKNKRASLSLPPTTDIFDIDDKSDNDTARRSTMQRAVTGEFPRAQKKKKKEKPASGKTTFYFLLCLKLFTDFTRALESVFLLVCSVFTRIFFFVT